MACALLLGVSSSAQAEEAKQGVGLFTSLPILWGEADGIADLLRQDVSPHWAREVIAARGAVVPLDRLTAIPAGLRTLVLAQPRPLAPDENVALDRWVRRGGRVLLFADPMLTFRSAYALGDRRAPEATVLLSPVLARWGLRLEFDEAQPFGGHEIAWNGVEIPVNLAGRFTTSSRGCLLQAGGLVARCRVGKGRVLAVADAALLETAESTEAPIRSEILHKLLETLYLIR